MEIEQRASRMREALAEAREYVSSYIAHNPLNSRDAMIVLNKMDSFIEISDDPAPTAADTADGNRPLPFDRDELGRMVREAWVRWAQTTYDPKPSWLVPYDDLAEPDKEADRQIGEAVARWTIIGDAARNSTAADTGGLVERLLGEGIWDEHNDEFVVNPVCHEAASELTRLQAALAEANDTPAWDALKICQTRLKQREAAAREQIAELETENENLEFLLNDGGTWHQWLSTSESARLALETDLTAAREQIRAKDEALLKVHSWLANSSFSDEDLPEALSIDELVLIAHAALALTAKPEPTDAQ